MADSQVVRDALVGVAGLLSELDGLLLELVGHNFINLARYGPTSDRTHRSWAKKPVPWVQLNSTLVSQAQDSVRLKRQVRIVAVVWLGSRRTEVLFSTSTEMTAATIIALYWARFSMEFPFWDGKRARVDSGAVLLRKQCAGLSAG